MLGLGEFGLLGHHAPHFVFGGLAQAVAVDEVAETFQRLLGCLQQNTTLRCAALIQEVGLTVGNFFVDFDLGGEATGDVVFTTLVVQSGIFVEGADACEGRGAL